MKKPENVVRPRAGCLLKQVPSLALHFILMDNILFDKLYSNWQNKQLRFQKNRKGHYLHFDRRISFEKNQEWFYSYFKNSVTNIKKHSFYPFIKLEILTPRVRFDYDEKLKKKVANLTPKPRPIAYCSHFDSFIYSWYSDLLTYHYQKQLTTWGIEDCVLAYLKKNKQCNIHFANDVFEFIKKKTFKEGECVALAFDLSSFFDTLDHDILKKNWCKILNVPKLPADHHKIYQTLTNYSYIEKEFLDIRFPSPVSGVNKQRVCNPLDFRKMIDEDGAINKNPYINLIPDSKRHGKMCGIPQGSPLSGVLSNVYMISFDIILNSFAHKKGGLYRRYCDDLIIICSKKDLTLFEHLVKRTIIRHEVCINSKKTEKIFFCAGEEKILSENDKQKHKKLQYLGFEFDGNKVYIRSSSMSRYHRKMSLKVDLAVQDAYDPEFSQKDFIFRKSLYNRFTSSGKSNFITYGIKAQKIMSDSTTIKNQIKGSIEKLERKINKSRLTKEKSLNKKEQDIKRMR